VRLEVNYLDDPELSRPLLWRSSRRKVLLPDAAEHLIANSQKRLDTRNAVEVGLLLSH
jgi:hypothetical protein